jgi:hypothetical protein
MPEPHEGPVPEAYPTSLMDWCTLVCRGSVVRRGLKFAVVVGAILIAINHGDAILSGNLTRTNYFKMALTVVVPYVVSVLSSVGAIADSARQRRHVTRGPARTA